MNWEAIGAIGEVLGAIAVVTTLIYLAKQMNINTSAIKQTAAHSTLMGRAESLRFLASDAEISSIWWTGAFSPEELTEDQSRRYFLLWASMLRPIEIAFLDHRDGRMSGELWKAQHEAIVYWARGDGLRLFFDQYGKTFHLEFQEYVRNLIDEQTKATANPA